MAELFVKQSLENLKEKLAIRESTVKSRRQGIEFHRQRIKEFEQCIIEETDGCNRFDDEIKRLKFMIQKGNELLKVLEQSNSLLSVLQ